MANHTRNRWTQDTPNPDGQIFVGVPYWTFINTVPAVADTSFGDGLPYYNMNGAAATYGGLTSPIELTRTGVLATSSLDQQQFGTAALQPGPSSVANTSDPLGIRNFPPYANSKNPIYGAVGNVAGAVLKGFQVNWVDVIYSTGANAITTINFGLAAVNFVNNIAPVKQDIIAYANNGLPTAAQANPYVKRITVANPAFYTLTDTNIVASLLITTGGAGTTLFYGIVLGVSFNFN